MKNFFHRAKLSQQLALVNSLCVLVPTLLLWFTMLWARRTSLIQTRVQEAESQRAQLVAQVEKTVELCNMSTQVFLNTPALVEHLEQLKNGVEPDAQALMEFYRGDIASLEKIVLSNPYLYQIRVYSVEPDAHEMMPILYNAQRMQRMPWAQGEFVSGSWQLDFSDQLFPSYAPTAHVMSLITCITTPESGTVGVLEVAAQMDELMPELFAPSENSWAVLVGPQGQLVAGSLPAGVEESELPALLSAAAQSENGVAQTTFGRKAVLAASAQLKDFGCIYLRVAGLSDIQSQMVSQAGLLLAVVLALFVVLTAAVSALTRRMLRGFYQAFDGVKAFAEGDLDATVEVDGEDEVSRFAAGIGDLLNKIRQLMQDNLEREMLMKNSELRALQNQINAHFIYNVLEAIKMMAEIDEEYEIADAVTTLGKLLRYGMKLEKGGVKLSQELEYIQNYLALMNLRFDYSVQLRLDVPEELMDQQIPKISLQPIVENAVVHGAAALEADSCILLCGRICPEDGSFTISITDEGAGLDETGLARLRRQIAGEEQTRSSSGNGIGLKNVQDRIHMNYGAEYGLSVASQPGAGTTVTVRLPYRPQPS